MEKELEVVFNSLKQTSSNVEEISANSHTLSASMNTIVNSANFAAQKIQETDLALNLIKSISNQSNLLALNASIESARAGEAGRGFSVVAGEMSKLSKISDESAKKIMETLLEMRKSMDNIITEINNVSQTVEAQTKATEQVSDALAKITDSFESLMGTLK